MVKGSYPEPRHSTGSNGRGGGANDRGRGGARARGHSGGGGGSASGTAARHALMALLLVGLAQKPCVEKVLGR